MLSAPEFFRALFVRYLSRWAALRGLSVAVIRRAHRRGMAALFSFIPGTMAAIWSPNRVTNLCGLILYVVADVTTSTNQTRHGNAIKMAQMQSISSDGREAEIGTLNSCKMLGEIGKSCTNEKKKNANFSMNKSGTTIKRPAKRRAQAITITWATTA